MGFKFRKSVKIAPGVKANIGKKSVGLSFGTKGAHYSVNSNGKETASIGVPGTGVSYSSSRGGGKSGKSGGKGGCMMIAIPLLIVLFIVGGIKSCIDGDGETTTTTEPTTEVSTSIDDVFAEFESEETATTEAQMTSEETIKEETTTKKSTTTKKETTTEKKEVTTEKKTTTEKVETTKKSTSRTVYRTPSGKRYHFDPECGGKNSYSVSLDDAKDAGLTPCEKCAQ